MANGIFPGHDATDDWLNIKTTGGNVEAVSTRLTRNVKE